MAINLSWLASHETEQFSETCHMVAPDFGRHSESIENRSQMLRSQMLRSRALLVASNLPSRPVQQTQIIGDRHRQKSLVAATLALSMTAWPRLAAPRFTARRQDVTSAQIDWRQMTRAP